MTATVIGLTERQQAVRATGIGASEVAQVVGLVPGAIEVYAKKVGELPEDDGSSLSEFGTRIEEVIGDGYQARHPETRIYKPGTLRHPRFEWAVASPDRVVAPPGVGRPSREAWLRLLEIKTVFFSAADYGLGGTDEVPERHLVQVAWQMAVTDMNEATLVALVNGDYREFPIARDRELEGLLLDQVGKFWKDHVLARRPPAPDGSDAYESYVRRRHPHDTGPMLDATPAAAELVAHLREAKAAVKAAEEQHDRLRQELEVIIGNHPGIAGLCTWRANRPTEKVEWEHVARNIATRYGMTPEQLLEVARSQTITRPGPRVLRLQTSKKGA